MDSKADKTLPKNKTTRAMYLKQPKAYIYIHFPAKKKQGHAGNDHYNHDRKE
jgi:hypothetical protein